jgi:hypothetical protein
VSPLSGADIQALLKQLAAAPPALIERYRAILETK